MQFITLAVALAYYSGATASPILNRRSRKDGPYSDSDVSANASSEAEAQAHNEVNQRPGSSQPGASAHADADAFASAASEASAKAGAAASAQLAQHNNGPVPGLPFSASGASAAAAAKASAAAHVQHPSNIDPGLPVDTIPSSMASTDAQAAAQAQQSMNGEVGVSQGLVPPPALSGQISAGGVAGAVGASGLPPAGHPAIVPPIGSPPPPPPGFPRPTPSAASSHAVPSMALGPLPAASLAAPDTPSLKNPQAFPGAAPLIGSASSQSSAVVGSGGAHVGLPALPGFDGTAVGPVKSVAKGPGGVTPQSFGLMSPPDRISATGSAEAQAHADAYHSLGSPPPTVSGPDSSGSGTSGHPYTPSGKEQSNSPGGFGPAAGNPNGPAVSGSGPMFQTPGSTIIGSPAPLGSSGHVSSSADAEASAHAQGSVNVPLPNGSAPFGTPVTSTSGPGAKVSTSFPPGPGRAAGFNDIGPQPPLLGSQAGSSAPVASSAQSIATSVGSTSGILNDYHTPGMMTNTAEDMRGGMNGNFGAMPHAPGGLHHGFNWNGFISGSPYPTQGPMPPNPAHMPLPQGQMSPLNVPMPSSRGPLPPPTRTSESDGPVQSSFSQAGAPGGDGIAGGSLASAAAQANANSVLTGDSSAVPISHSGGFSAFASASAQADANSALYGGPGAGMYGSPDAFGHGGQFYGGNVGGYAGLAFSPPNGWGGYPVLPPSYGFGMTGGLLGLNVGTGLGGLGVGLSL